jgi:hypothetical protein
MQTGRAVKVRSENIGALVKLPCPQCGETHWFKLVCHSSSFGVLGITLSKASAWSVHCENCDYQIDISKEDAEKSRQLLFLASQCFSGEVSEEHYNEALAATGLNFLAVFVQSNTTWVCPECREENPNTFGECWNCGALNRNMDDVPNEVKTPSLDRALAKNEAMLDIDDASEGFEESP